MKKIIRFDWNLIAFISLVMRIIISRFYNLLWENSRISKAELIYDTLL